MPNTLHLKSMIAPGDPPVHVVRASHTKISSHNHDFYELVYVTDGFCVHDSGGSVSLLTEGDGTGPVSMSVGIAFSDRDRPDGDVFQDADTALQRMREVRRTGYAVF